jgi:hypothetical protein
MDWPGQIEAIREVDIETRRADDAPAHRTTIWAVVDDGTSSSAPGGARWVAGIAS